MPTKRVSKQKSSYIYHIDAKYRDYPNTNKDKAIISMARASGGKFEGSGMGFGYRDLGFLFKSRADATRFINKLKANRIRRSGISDWSKYM